MLFIVCSLFAFLWLPIQTYNLLKDFFFEINRFAIRNDLNFCRYILTSCFSLSIQNSYRYINVIWFVFHFMAMLSASVNPFIYSIYSVGSCSPVSGSVSLQKFSVSPNRFSFLSTLPIHGTVSFLHKIPILSIFRCSLRFCSYETDECSSTIDACEPFRH